MRCKKVKWGRKTSANVVGGLYGPHQPPDLRPAAPANTGTAATDPVNNFCPASDSNTIP